MMSSRRVMINYGSYIELRYGNTQNHNRKHYHRNKNHRQSKLRVSYLGIIYKIHVFVLVESALQVNTEGITKCLVTKINS